MISAPATGRASQGQPRQQATQGGSRGAAADGAAADGPRALSRSDGAPVDGVAGSSARRLTRCRRSRPSRWPLHRMAMLPPLCVAVGGCSARSTQVCVRRPCLRRSETARQSVIGAGGGRRENIGAGAAQVKWVCVAEPARSTL
eukprot:3481106-Prymnesium_polylepis.1